MLLFCRFVCFICMLLCCFSIPVQRRSSLSLPSAGRALPVIIQFLPYIRESERALGKSPYQMAAVFRIFSKSVYRQQICIHEDLADPLPPSAKTRNQRRRKMQQQASPYRKSPALAYCISHLILTAPVSISRPSSKNYSIISAQRQY